MSNSKLVDVTILSPHHSGKRTHKIDTISIHCMAGNLTVEVCGQVFKSRKASSQYGIGSDGRIGLYVDECNRSWCTSSRSNDQRAITIEVANCSGSPDWKVSDKALESLVALVTDICKRNDIKELLWVNDKSLIGQVDKQNLTVHRWFAAKACPGDYLLKKHPYIVEQVNRNLSEVIHLDMTIEELEQKIKDTVKGMGLGEPADSWAVPFIEEAKKMGITDGSNPKRLATREEVMTMVSRVKK